MEKESVDRHQGKNGGQVVARYGAEALLAVKMLGRNKLGGGAKINIADAMCPGMGARIFQ
ncbi:hypothetical protein [Sodalis glossinidius]|uniref:hypothetical protein n=1 Tax=Sodalis glossinidius TaxID=63612 RepID=UPI00159C20D4|nr:hypothetical protein [Sodalis glossinidius]